MALLVLIAGWLVPGAGHFLLGKWVRGLLLFVTLVLMFSIGMALQGKIYSPNTGDLLDILNFAGDLGTGLLYVVAKSLRSWRRRRWSRFRPTTGRSSLWWLGC